jgi:DNA repair protein RadA/Sms
MASYFCENCGAKYTKWLGKCQSCNTWDCIHEESASSFGNPSGLSIGKSSIKSSGLDISEKIEIETLNAESVNEVDRLKIGIEEFDRVLGGGFVYGSAILIGGDPGIGKSTLLMQVVLAISSKAKKCLYVSSEESVNQINIRAKRLGLIGKSDISVVSTGMIDGVISSINKNNKPDVIVLDSIQGMYLKNIESNPGSVTQIRSSAYEMINFCKAHNIVLVLIGHVTKDGTVAGPKLLEHMVDAMLYFEGDNNNYFRIIRSIKNRFGAANEIGIFTMTSSGLEEVKNPSAVFLSPESENISGKASFCTVEGTRPMILELESLVSKSFIPNPRRVSIGCDSNRVSMITAVLSTKYNLPLGDKDLYISILGGLKTNDPGVDLAIAVSIISAFTGKSVKEGTISIGEISLSGKIRSVSQIDIRINEAIKLGFKNIIIPKSMIGDVHSGRGVNIIGISNINEISDLFFGN